MRENDEVLEKAQDVIGLACANISRANVCYMHYDCISDLVERCREKHPNEDERIFVMYALQDYMAEINRRVMERMVYRPYKRK